MARTAVIAGTATAVSGNMQRSAQARDQAAADQAAVNEAALQSQAELAAMRQQMAAQPAPVAAPAPAAPPADDLLGQLERLASLKTAGVLTDEEFLAAKAKLLG